MRVLFISILVLFSSHLFADKTDYFSFSGGCFDFMRKRHRCMELRLEYKPSFNLQTLRPLFGAMANFKGNVYLYGGMSLDLFFTNNLFMSPSLAAGFFFQGKGKKLGFPIEFRSAFELGYRFDNLYRIGVQICHISNASLGNRNPGCESIVMSFYIPIKKYK